MGQYMLNPQIKRFIYQSCWGKCMGIKSETEYKLEKLQKDWLDNDDKKAYQEMFNIIVQYSRSIILKMTKGKKFLDPDFVMDKAIDSTIKFFEQYEKNSTFRIDFSFGGVLRYKVLECLYGPEVRKTDAVVSINSYIGGDDTDELESLQEKLDMRPVWSSELEITDPVYKMYHTEETVMNTVFSVIRDLYKTIPKKRDIIIILIALLHTFRKMKSKTFDEFREKYLTSNELRDTYEMSILEIRNRLADEV
jgi:hypothetical protein